jgi:hypothetical protein
VIVFSEDNDHHAVNNYTEKVTENICGKMDYPMVVQVIFSDVCASQYTSAGPLSDVSLNRHKVVRKYFGSEHGKYEGISDLD